MIRPSRGIFGGQGGYSHLAESLLQLSYSAVPPYLDKDKLDEALEVWRLMPWRGGAFRDVFRGHTVSEGGFEPPPRAIRTRPSTYVRRDCLILPRPSWPPNGRSQR
jgi:hypothetical protein